MPTKLTLFWFRRDLRLSDNVGLNAALSYPEPVLPLFIFDRNILDKLHDSDDQRVTFIHQLLTGLNTQLRTHNTAIYVQQGRPLEVFQSLVENFDIARVVTNRDYEPYARKRDDEIRSFLKTRGVSFETYKDQVIFEPGEVLKDDGDPYTVYTPYKNRWYQRLETIGIQSLDRPLTPRFFSYSGRMPTIADVGFTESKKPIPPVMIDSCMINEYGEQRDIPSLPGTSRLSHHLRFGSIGIRTVYEVLSRNKAMVNELIWREFFQQIFYYFPRTAKSAFKAKYDSIPWRDSDADFQRWCEGRTGVPLVDAGMRELNSTGFMHNRVRMVVSSYLTKHLLIDWRRGERYFARMLLDYDKAVNVGNWQWAAGSGVDAAPYFRVFNPETQQKKFDSQMKYIRKWIPEFGTAAYPAPMVDHKFARERAIRTYKTALDAATAMERS